MPQDNRSTGGIAAARVQGGPPGTIAMLIAVKGAMFVAFTSAGALAVFGIFAVAHP